MSNQAKTSNLRELIPPGGQRKQRTADQMAAAAPLGLDYPATQVGVVGNIKVLYDSALGAQGLALANQMLHAVSGPYSDMQTDFGVAGGATSVVIAPLSGRNDGSGGAYHYGCDFASGGVLYLDATFASTSVNPLNLEVALYVAELSEAFMGTQGKGWGCGFSNGEALSRFLAEQETPDGTLNAFVTGPAWDKAGRPDWISKTENTDRKHRPRLRQHRLRYCLYLLAALARLHDPADRPCWWRHPGRQLQDVDRQNDGLCRSARRAGRCDDHFGRSVQQPGLHGRVQFRWAPGSLRRWH